MVRPDYVERSRPMRPGTHPEAGWNRITVKNAVLGTEEATGDARQTFLKETAVAGARHILTPVGRFGGCAGTRAAVALSLPRG